MNLSPKKIKEIASKTQFNFKNAQAKQDFENYEKINKHNTQIVDFILVWGKCMQYAIKKENLSVEDAADETHIACAECMNIGSYAFDVAVKKLAEVWQYGEKLAAWNNKLLNGNIKI